MRVPARYWLVAFSLLAAGIHPASNFAADPGTWQEARSIQSALGTVTALALSPDGDRVAVGAMVVAGAGQQHRVMLCSLADHAGFLDLGAHEGEIRAVAFSPDGSIVATTGDDQTVKLWDMRHGNEVQTVPVGSPGFATAFTPDGHRLIAGGHALSVWSVPALRRVVRVDDVLVSSVAVSPDGTLLATGELPRNTRSRVVRLRSPATGEILRTFDDAQSGVIWSLAFSTDGRCLASGSADGTARIWDVDSGKLSASHSPGIGPINSVALSPDGSLISLGNRDQPLQLWSVESGQRKFTLPAGTGRCAVFSSDGATLITSGNVSPLRDRLIRAEIRVWRFVE
jgi:WD40 repeat protein